MVEAIGLWTVLGVLFVCVALDVTAGVRETIRDPPKKQSATSALYAFALTVGLTVLGTGPVVVGLLLWPPAGGRAIWLSPAYLALGPPLPVILISALWAAWDSSAVGVTRYRTGVSYTPVVLFFAICLLWIVGFPWYVYTREQIRRGLVPPREQK